MQQAFYRLLSEARERGSTVFLSSHVMPEVEHVCDRVGIIRDGRLVAVEDIDDLKGKALKLVEVRLATPAPAGAFDRVPGVREAVAFGDRVRSRGPDPSTRSSRPSRVTRSWTCRAVSRASRRSSSPSTRRPRTMASILTKTLREQRHALAWWAFGSWPRAR